MIKDYFECRTGHPLLEELKKYIYAHRGFHDAKEIMVDPSATEYAPENSIPAFMRAEKRGWGVEFDVHMVKDGGLVVFHDSELKRCTGEEGILEDLTTSEAEKLCLEGTKEHIPTFDKVLEVCRNIPMIIELKAWKGNQKALAEAVCQRLDQVKSLFCIESFDPRAMAAVRKYRPQFVRGQLSSDFTKPGAEEMVWWLRPLLSDLSLDFLSKPDFIAYRFEDRDRAALRKAVKKGVCEFGWTIRTKADLDFCLGNHVVPIFELFDPEA